MGEKGNAAVVVAIYAALTYDIISATNSSPQTTEINAAVRADTLMKWVYLGLAQAAVFVAMGMYLDKSAQPAIGGGIAGVLLLIQYQHAKSCGIRKGGPGTEVYGGTG